jgi:hypothetical protein
MNILKKNNSKPIIVLLLGFNFLIFKKAISAYLSPDEAYTFLEYVYTNDILNIGLANNHLLNTFLIYLTTNISIDEFFIRSANVFFGIIYFFYAYKFSLLFKYSLPHFIFICSCPYLIDYFSIGRGYGISTSLIFLALNRILFEDKYKLNNTLLVGFIFLLSSYSIHTTLIYFGIFYFYFIKDIFLNINKKGFLIISTQALLALPVVYLIFNVTTAGKPVYGSTDLDMFNLLLTGFGLSELFLIESQVLNYLMGIIFYTPLIFFKFLKTKQKTIVIISYSSLFALYLLPFLFNKPFPVLRVLIPFLPGILMSVSFAISNISNYLVNIILYVFSLSLIISLFINFQSEYHIDWIDEFNPDTAIEFIELNNNQCNYTGYKYGDKRAEYYRILETVSSEVYCDPFTLTIVKNE